MHVFVHLPKFYGSPIYGTEALPKEVRLEYSALISQNIIRRCRRLLPIGQRMILNGLVDGKDSRKLLAYLTKSLPDSFGLIVEEEVAKSEVALVSKALIKSAFDPATEFFFRGEFEDLDSTGQVS